MRQTRFGIELTAAEALKVAIALENSRDWDAGDDPQEVIRAAARTLRGGKELRVEKPKAA